MIKNIFKSKVFRLFFSAILLYFAFRKVDVKSILIELTKIPLWFVLFNVVYSTLIIVLASVRWMSLIFEKIKWVDVWHFVKASYLGSFYTLFFPSMVAGDLLKWPSLQKHYPDLSKTKLLGSVLLDRIVGFSTFCVVAFLATITGKLLNYNLPGYLLFLFGGLMLGVIVFYLLAFSLPIDKIHFKWKILDKALEIGRMLKDINKKRLVKCWILSIICEFAWIFQVFLTSYVFKNSFGFLTSFIFLPVIALILILPISIAGFGAREQLYLLFFSQFGIPAEKILLVSTFIGLVGVLNSLVGGLLIIF